MPGITDPYPEVEYPFRIVDALVIKVRQDQRVRSHSVLLAVGVNLQGYREVLGIRIGDSGSKVSEPSFSSG